MRFVDHSARQFTSYQPSCEMYMNLQKQYAPNSTQNDFRYYLQANADQIMKDQAKLIEEFGADCLKKTCPICSASLDYKPKGNI